MQWWRTLVSLMLLVAGAVEAAAQAPAGYVLGPQDRVTIRVYDLRRNTGEAYSWAALNGEFGVGADGFVSLPILGRLDAAGGTPGDLATKIGTSLKKAADLAETPAASVEVAKYRPFYVTGAVQLPGKYEYQPNLTVLQAVSTAQGLVRAADLRLVQRDVVTAGGDLRTLAVERLAYESKLSRLEAEIAGRDTVEFSAFLRSRSGDAKADLAMRGERLLFETRRNSLRAEVTAIEQLKDNYRQELVSLDAKGRSLDRQVELVRRELDLVNDLVSKGLTITPRKLAAEQSQAAYESSRLDVQLATLRTQQSLSQSERDIIETRARFRREALKDASETRLKLDQNEEKARVAERLISDAEAQMLGSDGVSEILVASYEISRGSGASAKTWRAGENDPIEPGDVLRVSVSRPRTGLPATRNEAMVTDTPGSTGTTSSGQDRGRTQ